MEDYEKKYKDIVEKFDVVLNLNNVKESGTISVEDVRKIISELAESEDEKMRKALIRAFQSLNTLEKWNGISRSDIIDWLEKQKTDDKPKHKFNVGCIIVSNEYSNCANSIMSITAMQNPYYLCAYDNGQMEYTFEYIDENYHLMTIHDINSGKWSDKDKNMERHIGNAITTKEASNYLKEKNIEVIDAHVWLDKLKNRYTYQPQKKELTEEDKHIIEEILHALSACECEFLSDMTKEKNWIKCIEHQLQWKPSKEQLTQLRKYCPDNRLLTALYDDLKKLID